MVIITILIIIIIIVININNYYKIFKIMIGNYDISKSYYYILYNNNMY